VTPTSTPNSLSLNAPVLSPAPGPGADGDRDFGRLWLGQTVSALGTQLTVFSLPIVATHLGANAGEMGIVFALQKIPYVVFGLWAGVIVDRTSRRPILLVCDVARAALTGVLALALWKGMLTVPGLYAFAALTGFFGVFHEVATLAYVPTLVPISSLGLANSKMEGRRSVAAVVAPGLAGVVLGVSPPLAIAADALTFLISAITVMSIRTREVGAKRASASGAAAIREGLNFVREHPVLRLQAVGTTVYNFFLAMATVVYIPFATEELGMEPGHLGLARTVGNVGALVGAVVAWRLASRLGSAHAALCAVLIGSAGYLLQASTLPAQATAAIILGSLLTSIATPIWNVNQVTMRQKLSPKGLAGRVNATFRFLVYAAGPVGCIVAGFAADLLGRRAVLVGMAIGILLSIPFLMLTHHRYANEQDAVQR